MKKYELDKSDLINVNNHILYRVIYTDEFIKEYKERYGFTIEKKGGWIESEKNLTQDGYSVVFDKTKVYGNTVYRYEEYMDMIEQHEAQKYMLLERYMDLQESMDMQ